MEVPMCLPVPACTRIHIHRLCMAYAGRERLKPAVDEAASQVEPMTKDVTSNVIRPGGEQLSKNAVPMTKEIAENRVQPAVDQVSSSLWLRRLAFSQQNVLGGLVLLLFASDSTAWCRPGNLQQICRLRYDPCLATHLTVTLGL